MGFSVAWVAIRGKTRARVLDELKLTATGEREEAPESPIVGTSLPGGWYLVFGNRFDFTELLPLGWLSIDAELVTCAVEEHVMCSEASGWRNGERTWSVAHDAQKGLTHLAVVGDAPPILPGIHEGLAKRLEAAGGKDASDVDYIFDVPVELAAILTGFRHDRDCLGLESAPFERLDYPPPPDTVLGLLRGRRKAWEEAVKKPPQ
jgi:hypothetical protein